MADFRLNTTGTINIAFSDELAQAIEGKNFFGRNINQGLTPNEVIMHLIALGHKPIRYKVTGDTIEILPALIECKVEKNEFYGDFRVVKYINGQWNNEFDGNWSKETAEKNCAHLSQYLKK